MDGVSGAEFIKQVDVGQIFMVYLRHKNIYYPAKVVNVPITSTRNQRPSHLTVQLYGLYPSKSSKMFINLKNTPMKELIPFESVYQQYKNNKNIKSIQYFTYSPSFQKALAMAAKDYQERLKTPKMYKELKNSSIKFSQQLKNKTEHIPNIRNLRSKKKNYTNNFPILLEQSSQEDIQNSRTRSEIRYFSSVSSIVSNRSERKQNKCFEKDGIKKRGFNTMKGSESLKMESHQHLILQHPTKKRKTSEIQISVIQLQQKNEISKKILNYSESERISNRSKKTLVMKEQTKNRKNQHQKDILLISSEWSIKTRSQSLKNSIIKPEIFSQSKDKVPKKPSKQIPVNVKLNSTQTQKLGNKSVKTNVVKKKSTSKQNKKITNKHQTSQFSKDPKYQLLLSRFLFDHSKNKFPLLSQKGSQKAIFVKRGQQSFICQSNVEVRSFNDLINFTKRIQEQQKLNKDEELRFTLYEKMNKKERDPYILTYSRLDWRDSIQRIVLQDDKLVQTKYLSGIVRSEQWTMELFLLQSICSLIDSWNIINLQKKHLSKRGKGKNIKKNNTLSTIPLKCHQYCYSIGQQEKSILANLMEVIKMYFTNQNFTSQYESVQQDLNINSQIGQLLLQRMKSRYRHLLTYFRVIRIQFEHVLARLSLLSIESHQILKKQPKVQQCSISIQEMIGIAKQKQIEIKNKMNKQNGVICWINSMRKQLEELLTLMQKIQEYLASQINTMEKQRDIACMTRKQQITLNINNNNYIFAESLQLPRHPCFDHSSLPYEGCLTEGKKSSVSHLMQKESDLKEKEFQEFLKRVLNVESLEGVYTKDFQIDSQCLMRSEGSFSQMETLRSDIFNAFDEVQNTLLSKQRDEISY